jgi:DNA-binding GntR family transcriptional regulator
MVERDMGGFKQIWETIADDLKEAITTGDLKGGQRLRVEEVAAKYGVSSTPVRDAFRYLATLGFVENIPRRMVVVKEITLRTIEDIYAIQGVLEGLAARLAVAHCSDEDVQAFDDLLQRMADALARQDIPEYSKADILFHNLFLRLAHNDRLAGMVSNSQDHITRFRFIMLRTEKRLEASMAEHRRIVEAFRYRDAEAAEREVKIHILTSAELLKRIVKQGEQSDILPGS